MWISHFLVPRHFSLGLSCFAPTLKFKVRFSMCFASYIRRYTPGPVSFLSSEQHHSTSSLQWVGILGPAAETEDPKPWPGEASRGHESGQSTWHLFSNVGWAKKILGPPQKRTGLTIPESRNQWARLQDPEIQPTLELGVSIVMEVPLYRWMVEFMENPI